MALTVSSSPGSVGRANFPPLHQQICPIRGFKTLLDNLSIPADLFDQSAWRDAGSSSKLGIPLHPLPSASYEPLGIVDLGDQVTGLQPLFSNIP